MLCIIHGELRLMRRKIHIVMSEIVSDENDKWLRQELCVNGKAHSVDQVKTLILMYHVFL